MSEIKTILNFFDKNNGLDGIIKDLKVIKELTEAINKQKVQLTSPELNKRLDAITKITRLERQLANEKKKQIKAQEKANNERKESLGLLGKQRQEVTRLRKAQRFAQTEEELKDINRQLLQATRNVRKFGAAGKQSTNTFGAAIRSFGFKFNLLSDVISGVGFALSSGLRNALVGTVEIFKDFEQANANLAAVLGTTIDKTGALQENAKQLGATTAFTASQVTELQTEFAKLGFTETEILGVTDATLNLAAAAGTDLANAASITGSTLRAFGLDVSETGRVADVMAKSFSISSLDIEKFSTSMRNVAPVAASAGVSIERTTALLGTLTDSGLDASTAGTGLRNVFLELTKNGLTFEEAMDKIKNATDKNAVSLELFGKRGAVIGTILSNNTDKTKELTESLNEAGGFAEKTADTQLDTLSGSITKLTSAWEGFILSLEDGKGTFATTIRGFIDLTTEIFSLLSGAAAAEEQLDDTQKALRNTAKAVINVGKVLTVLVTSFITYKTVVAASNIVTRAAAIAQAAYSTVVGLVTGKIKLATAATKLFSKATKANPIGLIVTAITAAVTAFSLFRESTDEAVEGNSLLLASEEDLEKQVEATNKQLETRRSILETTSKEELKRTKSLKELKDELASAEKQLEELNLTAGEQLRKEAIARAFDGASRSVKDFSIASGDAENATSELEKSLKNEIEVLKDLISEKEKNNNTTEKTKKKKRELTGLIEVQTDKIKKLREEINRATTEENIIRLRIELGDAEDELERLNDLQNEEIKLLKTTEIAVEDLNSTQEKAFEERTKRRFQERLDEEKQNKIKERDALLAEEKRKEQQKKLIEDSRIATEAAIENAKIESEAKIESLDRQINAEQDFLSQNENLSAREIEFRREKAAELERQRIEEQKRLERLAKVQAFFDLVAAFASDGDGQGAVGKAATTIAAGEVIAEGFHDGGYTGDGNEYDVAGVTHKGEFVNTKAQTTEYGMKGWTAKDFDNAISDGYFNQFADSNIFADQNAKFLSVQNNQIGYDFGRLESELKSVKEAIYNSPTTDFEINGEYFIKRTHRKGTTTTKKRKLG